jgi:hypothetical protein
MSRQIAVALWIVSSLLAGCVPQGGSSRGGPAPAGAGEGRSSSRLAADAGRAGAWPPPDSIETDWIPWDRSPIPLLNRNSGNAGNPGPFRYTFMYPPGTSFGARRHSIDQTITVRRGRDFILMGNLDSARVQHFDAGATFVIPAGTWHVEWFETETVVDIQGVGPRQTEFASPQTPRAE